MPSRPAARTSSSGPPNSPPNLEAAIAGARAELAGLPDRDVELFEIRLARWWPDLETAWTGVYGQHPNGGDALVRLIRLLASRYRDRPAPLKSLDLRRCLQPDWFQEPDMIGYVCYADRFAGTLAGVAEHLDYLASSGSATCTSCRCFAAAPGETMAAMRSLTTGGRPLTGHDGRSGAACGRLRGARHEPVRRPGPQPHRSASTRGRGRPRRATRAAAMYYIYPDRTEPDAWERTLPEAFPDDRAGQLHAAPRRAMGVDDVQQLPVGPRLGRTPTCSSRWRQRARAWRRPASTSCGWMPSRSCGSGWGRTARTSRRCTTCSRRTARGADRRSGRGVQGGGDRRAARPRRLPRRRHGTRAGSATWHTTTSSWSMFWSALATRDDAPGSRTVAGRDAAGPPPATAG